MMSAERRIQIGRGVNRLLQLSDLYVTRWSGTVRARRVKLLATLGVKIDAQGAEEQILAGGRRTLERASYLEMELSPRPLYDGEAAMEDVLGSLHDNGFLLSLVENVASDGRSGRALQIDAVFTR